MINSNLVFVQNPTRHVQLLRTRDQILDCGCTGAHRATHAREMDETNLELTVYPGEHPEYAPELAARLSY